MPFLNPGHMWMLILLFIVVLIIFGPGKLPDVGAGMGRAIREFRHASHDTGPVQATDTSSPNGRAPEFERRCDRRQAAVAPLSRLCSWLRPAMFIGSSDDR